MKTKIILRLELAKPRNPICVAAKQRKAGCHEPEHPHRHARRSEKALLKQKLQRGNWESDED